MLSGWVLSDLIDSHQIFYRIANCKQEIEHNTNCIRENGKTSVTAAPIAPATSLEAHLQSISLLYIQTHRKRGLAKPLPNHLGAANEKPMDRKSQC